MRWVSAHTDSRSPEDVVGSWCGVPRRLVPLLAAKLPPSVALGFFVRCHDHECCPCATPRRRRSDRRSARPQTHAGGRVPRSMRRVGSGTGSSDCRRHASVIPGPGSGCRRHGVLRHSVRCSDGASGHSGGWPARGSAGSLAKSRRAKPRRALDSTEGERGQIRRAGTTQILPLAYTGDHVNSPDEAVDAATQIVVWPGLSYPYATPAGSSRWCVPRPVRWWRSLWPTQGSATICPWQRP